jgi:hypothetical protein
VNGDEEPDVNAVNLDDNDSMEDACLHLRDGGDFEIVDSEPRDEDFL